MALAVISCVSEETVTPKIQVLTSEADLVLSPEEGIIPVSFNVNVDWKAEIKEPEAKEWCTVSPAKGGKAGDNVLNVICIENKGTENRSATVLIKAMDVVQEVAVTQLQKDVLVITAEKEYNIPYQGKELNFKVAHNLDLKVRSDVDWITPVKSKALTEEELTFAVAPNTGEARTGKIIFTADPFREEIIVNQDAWVLEFNVSPAEDMTFDAKGGEHKIKVESNVDYTVGMDSNSWLTMTESDGEYTFTAVANMDMNARSVDVRISPKSAKYVSSAKIIKMSQKAAGAKLEVSETEKRITCLAQTFELTVDANVDYTMAYKKVVDGEYVDLPADENWLTHTVSGNTYRFTAPENPSWSERSLIVVFVPKDAAYSDMVTPVAIYQYGHAFRMWSRQITLYEGYDASNNLKLAQYGDKVLLANATKVYVLDPQTGEAESTISMPEGVLAQNLLVDDAGNFLIAADVIGTGDLTLYYVADPMNPSPEVIFTYNTGNYYSTETGNIRIKGNIKDDAVITAVASDGAGGALIYWTVTDGVCSDWNRTNVPYTAWNVTSLCAAPAGNTLADGLFYIGYGGDYNLYYAKNIAASAESDWTLSYVTGSTWQENYNCISTATWRGDRYAGILMGCHFNYDDADMLLLDVNNPASAAHVYTYSGTPDVQRDDAWVNLYWTGAGTYSDIVLVPTDDALLMVGADSNYGTITCVAIM